MKRARQLRRIYNTPPFVPQLDTGGAVGAAGGPAGAAIGAAAGGLTGAAAGGVINAERSAAGGATVAVAWCAGSKPSQRYQQLRP